MLFRRPRPVERERRHQDERERDDPFFLSQKAFKILVKGLEIIMAKIEDVESEVEQLTSVVDGAVVLIQSLRDEIKAAGTDPAKLQALVDKLDANEQKLANAIASNTEASGDVQP